MPKWTSGNKPQWKNSLFPKQTDIRQVTAYLPVLFTRISNNH